MASLLTIKLNKSPGTSWGIRLQGGKDFATPLCLQKVNSGSVAEKSGLQAGDAIVSINGHDVFNLRHKEAQDLIVQAGNNFDMVVQRGMQTWRPTVTPLPEVQRTAEGAPVATKTSLAATPQTYRPIGSGHNTTAVPFIEVPQKIVNAQFNTPINLYSEDAIAETLSAQAEVLSKGVLGINFKKYDREEKIRTDSPTYRLLHGEEDQPFSRKSRPPPVESESGSHLPFQHDPTEQQPAQQPGSKAPLPTQSFSPAGQVPHAGALGTEGLQPGDNICAGCERLITGVFVRVKNKNLHADCFKCSTCGSSLKNVGYYNINEKLYCDIHAKQAVRHHPPAPGLVPVTVQPGVAPPSGAMTSPQVRAMKTPFQSQIPSVMHPFSAPVSAPAPLVQPGPVVPEPPFVPAPAPIPEPTYPEPILEPLPVTEEEEEVEGPPAPPLDEIETPQEVEALHEEHISVDKLQAQEPINVDSISEEPEGDFKPLEQQDNPELVENHVQPEEKDVIEQSSHDYENAPRGDGPPPLPNNRDISVETEPVVDSHFVPEDRAITDESVHVNGIPNEQASELVPDAYVEKSEVPEAAPLLPFAMEPVGKGVSFETQQVLSSSYSKHVSEEESYVETRSSCIIDSDPSEILRVPVAPAPTSVPAPSSVYKVAPPAHAPVVVPSFHPTSANPQNFGAPAGNLNVRAHIPKKGQRFEWPPQRAVREDDEEAHPPAWAPSGEIPSVPKPVKPAGPPPKTPPLLPTPPPPKDYDVIVMKSSSATNIQTTRHSQSLTISKSQPPSILKSKSSQAKQSMPAPKPAPSQGPAPPLASQFPKLAPSYIIVGGANHKNPSLHNDIGQSSQAPSTKSTTPGVAKKTSANRSLISPPKLVPVTVAMPIVKLDTSPLLLSDPNLKPSLSQHTAAPVVALKTNTDPIIGFKPVSAPAPSKKVAPSAAHPLKHPAPPLPPAPVPVKSSLPASVPASAESVTPKPVPSNPSTLADAAPAQAPAQISSFGSNFMPKPTPPPGGIAFPKLGGSARGFQAPGQRSAPRRGRGVMNPASASRIPVCAACQRQIRGPFVSALGKTWCPDHFICATETCRKPIIEMGFVEEQGKLYCEVCYESYLAPICGKCDKRVKGDCLNAVGKQFHPECFCCAYCGKVFGSGAFYLEDGLPYCETDWNDLFTTKCVGCNFPIEAGDRWVEALNNNYHSQCFKCSKCHKNLEGQSFFAKGGKPFCKAHAQRGF